MGFYYYSLCHVCKKSNSKLKKCMKCKVPHYCSKEHQQMDFPNHKELCATIVETEKLLPNVPQDPAQFTRFKILTGVFWSLHLGRDLTSSEHQMWLFPKVCVICFSKNVKFLCENCWSVGYCSKKHEHLDKNQHEKFCDQLKLSLEIHRKEDTDETVCKRTNFSVKENMQQLPETIAEVIKMITFENNIDFQDFFNVVMMGELFCSSINIIYALEKSKFLCNRNGKKSSLVIHAANTEICENSNWDLLLDFFSQWIVNLKKIKIFVVSPDITEDNRIVFSFPRSKSPKKNCKGSITCLNGNYYDFVGVIPHPDLIVMFHTTLPESGTEAIQTLTTYRNVPIILTGYMQKYLDREVAKFPQSTIKFYVTPQENVYGSLRPVRNGEAEHEPVIYKNSYIAVLTQN